MKVNGAYKFRTKAIQDNFVSLYIKVEFGGENKISHDDFASIVSRGLVSDFFSLPQYIEGEELNPDLSTDVKVTLFASNGKGRVFYKREFPNYLQYSGISSGRLSVFSTAYGRPRGTDWWGVHWGNDYHYCLAELKAYIEINEDGLYSVYGVINPNSSLDVFTGLYELGEHEFTESGGRYSWVNTLYYHTRRGRTRHNLFQIDSQKLYYPILSFKDNEPLVEIGSLSHTVAPENPAYNPITVYNGNSFIADFFYVGAGVWTSPINEAASFVHKYPNTSIFPFSSPRLPGQTMGWSYYTDMDVSYSTTLSDAGYSYPLYASIIKDSKTGVLLESRQSSSGLVETLRDGILLPFDYSSYSNRESLGLGGAFYWQRPVFFLYDDNIYSCKNAVYDSEKGKWNITIEKNVSASYANYLGAIDPFLVDKTAQEFTLEHSGLDSEFTKALLENDENPFVASGTRCFSSETKTLWKYCNSAFIPESVAWEDKV
jgi:hypothetical protein